MGFTKISIITFGSASLIHFCCIMLFVNVFGWGFYGVCIATLIQFLSRFVISTIVYMNVPRLKNTTDAKLFSRESTRNIGNQLQLGIGGLFMGIWGWWAFDIFTLMASYLSIEAVAAQTILRSLGLMAFMIPVGFTTASFILIGQNIGANNTALITHYFYYCLYLSSGFATVTILIIIIGE